MRVLGMGLIVAAAALLLAGAILLVCGEPWYVFVASCPVALIGFGILFAHYRAELLRLRAPLKPRRRSLFGSPVNRYWLTNEEAATRAAIRQLLCSDWGCNVALMDTAFARGNDEVVLTLARSERVASQHDEFVMKVVDGSGVVVSTFASPDEAIDAFIKLWKEWQVGEYWVDFFGGSGCSGWREEG